MPTFQISVINHTFTAHNSHDAPTLDAAGKHGIKSALQIGADEVAGGKPFFAAEVRIAEGRRTVGRFMVSVGASPLQ